MRQRKPASLVQHGVWFTEQTGIAGTAYHMPLTVRFDGPLDVPALLEACAAVVRRHPALGSAFEERRGLPYVVPAASPPRVELRDLSSLPAGEREARLASAVAEEVGRPFDARRGPLFRPTLFRLAPERSVLLAVAHHLVFDGESKDVFVRDLSACYRDLLGGRPPALTPAPDGQAAQVAREQHGLDAAREFWRTWDRDVPGLTLPGLGRWEQAAAGESLDLVLDDELLRRVSEAGLELGVSRFELLLAGLQALLCRYGNREVAIAVDLSTRTSETAGSIGLFVNELPVASRPSSSSSFRQLAQATRAGLRALYRHRDVPLAQAVGGIGPRASLSPVSMSYRRRSATYEFPGVATAVDWTMFNGTVRGALHVQVVDGPDTLRVSLQHSPSALGRDAATRAGGHYVTLLDGIAAAPDAPLSELPLLTGPERARLVAGWSGEVPAATVPALFEAQAARTPGEPAVQDLGEERRTLTYAELDAAASRLARRLRVEGVRPGTVVALCAERSADLVVALLGVLKAGAAYLPLDPRYPARRLATVLEDAGAGLLLAHRRLLGLLPCERPRVLLLDELDDAGPAPGPPVAPALPGDLAYLIYTSGSTGQPKGVEVEHRSLVNLLEAMRGEVGGGGTWVALAPAAFDISALELFLPLVTGGRVLVAPDARDGAAVLRAIRAARATHVQATPSGWRVLLAAGFDESHIVALSGGEALPLPLARELRARSGRLLNVYGPTETTVWSTVWEAPAVVEAVTIGRPLAGTQAYVLDEHLHPVPAGVPGELHVGGAGLARGYRRRPRETALRFVPNPFGPPGSRLYRTGDSVRWRPDGLLEFLGRADDQVKIRGHRVELGEIEAGLLEHPGIGQAAAAIRTDGAGEPALVAYVIPRAGAGPPPAELRDHLARILPDHMLPTAFVTLERLPLTPNGKVERRALPEPPPERAASEPGGAALDGLARDVRDIWREVLRIDDIGPDDNLFEIGGHSLTATLIVSRIRKRLKREVPLHVFYDTPTVAGIVRAISGSRER